ncbi:MAG: hypothetical protein N2053_08400, partial [Chitinispirillaceae bacterium]|nr:hypothetical protein [Chitinispirillaceae bacterium]
QNIFLQWLKVVLNYSDRVPPYEIVRTAPLYDAESLIGELEKVFQFVSTLKDNELYKKTADILQQFLTGVVPEKSDFLYKYMESIGFTFEHQLANENKVSLENLKSALLTIYGLLTQKVQNVDYKKLGNFLDKDQLTKGIFEILTKYKEIEDLFKSKYSKYGLFLQQSNLSDLSDKSDFFYYNSSFIEESLTKDITKLTEVILKIFNKLSEIIKNTKEFNIPLKPSELSLVQETLEKAEKIYKILSSRREENLLENLFIEKRSEISTDVSLKQYSITTYNQTIKITEGLIDKIESFQLLAQKLQGHNGTSQVIVLPVKIGDEWTEVNIQLFNCKQKNKGRKSSKFLVSIEIAPRSLGEIHIHLDYNQNKKLQLCAEFEKDETYNWFSKHKEELNETLRGYGVLLLSLDFRKMSSHTSENKKSYFTISKSGTIDIKV